MSRQRLGVSLSRAHHAFMAVLEVQLKACGLAKLVRPGTGPVLFELLEEEDLSLSELSARARLAQSTVTEVIGKLVTSGLVVRRRDPKDGRVSRVQLTPKARQLRAPLEELDEQLNAAFAAGLSTEEVSQLVELLERLRTTLTKEREPAARCGKSASKRELLVEPAPSATSQERAEPSDAPPAVPSG